MKITALLENTASREDVIAEHGLSLYIETEKHRILFDMGQTDAFYKNAATLGIDLERVDVAVLSHGHYDHGGGLKTFLAVNPDAPVYVNRDAFLPHYNGTEKYIGLDTSFEKEPRIVFTGDEYSICEGLTIYTCNKNERKSSLGSGELTEKAGDAFIPDDFRHEQYLLIEEQGRKVLISGCSHKGIVNIAEWFSPDVLVGGFHFSKLPVNGELASAAESLDCHNTEYYTCHCTGEEQYRFMSGYMKKLHYLGCGDSITL